MYCEMQRVLQPNYQEHLKKYGLMKNHVKFNFKKQVKKILLKI